MNFIRVQGKGVVVKDHDAGWNDAEVTILISWDTADSVDLEYGTALYMQKSTAIELSKALMQYLEEITGLELKAVKQYFEEVCASRRILALDNEG